jgi:hypothetical protein
MASNGGDDEKEKNLNGNKYALLAQMDSDHDGNNVKIDKTKNKRTKM